MAKTLIKTTCDLQPDNSYSKTSIYYTTGLLARGLDPITTVTEPAISCSVFTMPAGTQLESFCTLDSNGAGVRRIIKFIDIQFLNWQSTEEVADSACDFTCDLNSPYVSATPTTTPTSTDGKIRLDVTTTYPPIVVYNATLGSPTTNTLYSAPGITPATYIVNYDNVAPGTYAFAIQDNNNCRFTTAPVVVAVGSAPGTGSGQHYDWFKYELTGNGFAKGTPFQLQGWAWSKATKVPYQVTGVPITYPNFYQQATYQKGDIVWYSNQGVSTNWQQAFFRATRDLKPADFPPTNAVPAPNRYGQSTAEWENVGTFYGGTIYYTTGAGFAGVPVSEPYFTGYRTPATSGGWWYYEENSVTRYGWDSFYRAKKRIESKYFTNHLMDAPPTRPDLWEKVNNYDTFYYAIPEQQAIDQYTIGTLARTVRYHLFNPQQLMYVPTSTDFQRVDGFDFVLFDDTTPGVETQLGDLVVLDVIKNDIDERGAENGSVAILATSPSMPIQYHLRNGVRTGYVQDNTTGIYERLSPGRYAVDITDANNRYASVEFDIEDRYQARWKLTFDDVDAEPLEIQFFERDWTGPVTDVCGTDTPVILSWDHGGDPAGYLPEAVGANLQFNVRTEVAQQFVDTILKDDRNHRIDYYRGGKLHFRGYIDATTYQEALLSPGQTVTLTATDGLGQLKNTKFINHRRERQVGRTSMLSILLKCLSFCDVNLPLYCGNNLRDELMTANGDPYLEAYVNRSTYDQKDGEVIKDEDIIDCRTVLDAILRVFNAQLFQADGSWRIIALNEVHDVFATRVFSPAGTLLTGMDTTMPPLRILPDQDATGPRELYWINSTQSRTTVAAAQILKATIDLKLEANLLRNGEFAEWDAANTRPLYWSTQGTPGVTRAKGEKAKEYAVQFAGYSTTLSPSNYLLSPAAPHLEGQDEDGMVVEFKAQLTPTTQNPAELTATLNFQVVCDGAPVGPLLPVLISSKDKWKKHTLNLPMGLPGTSVRVRLIKPVATDVASLASTLSVSYVALAIQPGLVDWSDVKQDFVEVENNEGITTGIRLDDVELAHADLPLLPAFNSKAMAPKKMDVYAWRHAVSLADFTATTAWKRPGYPNTAPLLDNAAQDRMALRSVPSSEVTGEVAGPGIHFLRIGLMLDMPEDLEGKFLVLSCFKNERMGTARITVRKLGDGYYGNAQPDVPDDARIGYKNGRLGYRISVVNGAEGFRTAQP
ncbi:hypothetical protein AUC43_15340 [Hymenobacter sedentarius]|uniref:Uncharacterized protein n=1 Tax=Hymenobacter sedentarius TaxID=1411621 RepID=A0A0U4C188_9BACT|nr:hypothetical protein [Hymenobacter sedentarius]ALW86337.1 hypothetical protein AUC43_15340 [Hymenobacter sedentarius]